jgi:hypothetical protein
MSGVSLPGLGVSLATVGVSLVPSSNNMPWTGESLKGIGVSLVFQQNMTPAIAGIMKFNSTTNTQYIPVLIGFM